MKKTVGRDIFLMLVIPALVIIVGLSLYLLFLIYGNAVKTIELELKEISSINAATINAKIESAKHSVQSTAYILERADPKAANARAVCENAIISMFATDSVYNVWLAYEPDAFDGEDKKHTREYPGAPSGRFIRSFVKHEDKVIVAPDMDENILNDEKKCPWYAIPLKNGELYVDVDNETPNLYDYNVSDITESFYTLSIVMPIKRGENVIGCIGADVVFDEMITESDNIDNTFTAIFYPNGRMFYAPGTKYSEETLESLSFSSVTAIKKAFELHQDIFLYDEHSRFSPGRTFAYFMPLEDGLYIFKSLPREYALRDVKTMTAITGGIFAVVLAMIFAFSVFVTQRISTPIGKLVASANALANGETETDIVITAKADSIIHVLSQSLGTILEQFRSNLTAQKYARRQFDVYSYMTRFLYVSKSFSDALRATAAMFCDYFNLHKATIVYVKDGEPHTKESYEARFGFHTGKNEFIYHSQISSLLSNKDIVCLNTYTISQNQLQLFSEKVAYACIVPMRAERTNYGYIILETDNIMENFTAFDEAAYTYIATTLSQWISCRDKEAQLAEEAKNAENIFAFNEQPPPAVEAEEKEEEARPCSFSQKLEGISGLDAQMALKVMGGLEDVYESAFKITHRMLPESVRKMDSYLKYNAAPDAGPQADILSEDDDLTNFIIEVHGAKGSLNNIGCAVLGHLAAKLEQAAKDGDLDYCRDNYGDFRKSLLKFHEQTEKALGGNDLDEQEDGDNEMLSKSLAAIKAACEDYEAHTALEILAELRRYKFPDTVSGLLENLNHSLEEFNYENGLDYILQIEEVI